MQLWLEGLQPVDQLMHLIAVKIEVGRWILNTAVIGTGLMELAADGNDSEDDSLGRWDGWLMSSLLASPSTVLLSRIAHRALPQAVFRLAI